MKKAFLLTVLGACLAFSSFAQDASVKRTEEYCEIKKYGKNTVQIDYGQKVTFDVENLIRDEKGKPMTFNSAIDALNYMNSLGWELVNAFVVVAPKSKVGYSNNIDITSDREFHYVMRRKIAPSTNP